MKGKYAKKKQKNTGFRWILIVALLLILAVAGLWIAAIGSEEAPLAPPETTVVPETTQPTAPETTQPAASIQAGEEFRPINLGYGVQLERVDSYTGTYMEDGTDQLVSGVMMIRIVNNGEKDIQLMNIEVAYTDATYHFMVTNLPAGGSAVLLELGRSAMPDGVPVSALAKNVVVFQENMEVDTARFEISGIDGALNLKNISDEAVEGSIYVYYKYKIQDVYYGGITFRVEIKGGLAAGEIRQMMTSHFNPDNCEVVMVEVVPRNGT